MDVIRGGLYEILAEQHPATVRGTFYQAVSRGLVRKTETEYKATVVRLLGEMRRDGELPYGWLADSTRWQRKPQTHTGLERMLRQTAQLYRRDLWEDQDIYVEVWLEKDALASVIYDVTSEYVVPLMVTRGYPSLSFVHEAAEAMDWQDKPIFIYYLGDLDPSGVDIPRWVEEQLHEMAPDADITFERLAVLPEQVEELNLPTRPTKTSDSRAKTFSGESVEVDAIGAPILRRMVEDALVDHIDTEAWARLLDVEAAERETLHELVAQWPNRGV